MLKKKNVLEKFRTFFHNELSWSEQRDLWDVLTALRGDDTEKAMNNKILVTARIRGELLRRDGTATFGGYSFQTLKSALGEIGRSTSYTLMEDFKKGASHWKQHVTKAIYILLAIHPSRAKDLKKYTTWMKW